MRRPQDHSPGRLVRRHDRPDLCGQISAWPVAADFARHCGQPSQRGRCVRDVSAADPQGAECLGRHAAQDLLRHGRRRHRAAADLARTAAALLRDVRSGRGAGARAPHAPSCRDPQRPVQGAQLRPARQARRDRRADAGNRRRRGLDLPAEAFAADRRGDPQGGTLRGSRRQPRGPFRSAPGAAVQPMDVAS